MKKEATAFVAGFMSAGIILYSITGLAEGITKSIEVEFNRINLQVNGKSVPNNNFLYNSKILLSTYLH